MCKPPNAPLTCSTSIQFGRLLDGVGIGGASAEQSAEVRRTVSEHIAARAEIIRQGMLLLLLLLFLFLLVLL